MSRPRPSATPGGSGPGGAGPMLRAARPEDVHAVVEMVRALNRELAWPECRFTAEHFLRDGFGEDPAFRTLVAERDGRPVGYAMWHGSYDTETAWRGSYLVDLYVRPEARSGGVGRVLLAGVARATREAGGEVVWWVTPRSNEGGRAFYRGVGRSVPEVEVWVAEGERFEALARGEGDPVIQ